MYSATGLTSGLPDRYIGFKECQEEVMHYLVEVEGWDAMDQLCSRMMAHLQQAGEKFRAMNKDSPTSMSLLSLFFLIFSPQFRRFV